MLGSSHAVFAQTVNLPSGFSVSLIANGLNSPTSMTVAPDGRVFVTEQNGSVRIIQNSTLLSTPFLTISVNSNGERGLLGLEFDPNFASNNYVYIYYTTSSSPIHNRISRFTANGNLVVPGSEVIIFELNNLASATNHNGGAIHFGPDGMLYAAVGENATPSNAQSMNNLLGKILRIAKDGSIPSSNPFYTTASGNNRAIWALGLRNPFNFAFQPGTGRMFINDVGQNTWEEINDGIAGSNYGWPTTEGTTNNPSFRSPLYAYHHSQGTITGCAIIGAAFYNPTTVQFPSDYVGDYFFGDYCGNWIRRYDIASGTVQDFASNIASSLADIKVLPNGSLYYLSRGGGSNTGALYNVYYTPTFSPPSITQDPASQTVAVGEAVLFTCSASGTAVSYRWQRNTVNIPGASSSSYRIPAAAMGDNSASFRCVAFNSAGNVNSASAQLTVINGTRPIPSITLPVGNTLFKAGYTVAYSGTATDGQDGTLPASAFAWEIVKHHDQHTHPLAQATGNTQGTFDIPVESHNSINIWYRIHLTVTDSSGLSASVYRDILLQSTQVRVLSVPSGLQVMVDGQPKTTPFVTNEIVGVNWLLGATPIQFTTNKKWYLQYWSDGGAATHNVTIPASPMTYTVTYYGCPEPLIATSAAVPPTNYYVTSQPMLTWNRTSWVTGFEIQVDSDPLFGHPQYINNNLPGTALAVTVSPLQDCLYYWRIRAKDLLGVWQPWSASNSFIVDVP
jgi:glucose/arabinose dehydrogenase